MRKVFIWFVLYYLRFWARLALFIHKPKVIGITGSVGKSSARNAINALLKDHFRIKVIEKGNSETGIPLGILGLTVTDYSAFDWMLLLLKAPISINYLHNTQYLVIEMGVDEPDPPKNMGFLLTIVKPDIAIFLNAYPAHTLQFSPTPQQIQDEQLDTDDKKLDWIVRRIAYEKGKIITEPDCKVGIYNIDNIYVNEVLNNFQFSIINSQSSSNLQKESQKPLLFSFGKDETNAVSYGNYEVGLQGSIFTFYLNIDNKKESILLKINGYALPEEYREIFASAILVGKYLGLSNYQITQSLQKNYSVPKGRSSMLRGIVNSLIIDSSYNASKAAVLAFLHMAKRLKEKEKRQLVFIFGDMRELGEAAKYEHEAVAREIMQCADYLYCVGELTEKYVIPICEELNAKHKTLNETKHFKTSVEAGKYLQECLPAGSIVLVKGSQNTIFLEEAVKLLLNEKEDAKNLCRQEEFWMKKKAYFYK